MLARRDLSVQLPFEKLFDVQEYIISLAHSKNIPIWVATGLLQSLKSNLQPTPSEVDGVRYLLQRGVDGFVFSNETARAIDPVNSIAVMQKIIRQNVNVKLYNSARASVFS